jgi:hypothetical protein
MIRPKLSNTSTDQQSLSDSLQKEVAAALTGTAPVTQSAYHPNRNVFNFDQDLDWVTFHFSRRILTDMDLGIL